MLENKIYILSTRPLEDELTSSAGDEIVIDSIPFIDTTPIENTDLKHRLGELSSRPLTAVFTSMNAIDAIADIAGPSSPWTICCIEGATREKAAAIFGPDKILVSATSAKNLAEAILASNPPAEIFFFCGDQRRDELPDLLNHHNIQVNELVVYQTRQTPHRLEKNYAGIAFFSPSAVHSYFLLNTPKPETILFAIGQTTEDTIHRYCSNQTIRSRSPHKETLIRQAIDHFKK